MSRDEYATKDDVDDAAYRVCLVVLLMGGVMGMALALPLGCRLDRIDAAHARLESRQPAATAEAEKDGH